MYYYEDDAFAFCETPCAGCDQREFALNRAAQELKELQRVYVEWKKKSAKFEDALEGMMEDLCHTIGIPFTVVE